MRVPLYLKAVGWLLFTLLVVAIAAAWFAGSQLNIRIGDVVSGAASAQLRPLAQLIESEIEGKPPRTWPNILKTYEDAYSVSIGLFRPDGSPVVPKFGKLPPQIQKRFPAILGGPPENAPQNERGEPRGERPPPRLPILHTNSPNAYWALLPIELEPPAPELPKPHAILVIRSESPSAGGLFFDARPWILGAAGLIVLSAILWIPFIAGMTRTISQMKSATRRMAEGRFDVMVRRMPNDELGELGHSINRMATKLDGYISGQKRFIGAIAHELCAPLARMQLALGILERRTNDEESVRDLREEADHMNDLVSEALAFSRASTTSAVRSVPVGLADLATRVAKREGASDRTIEVEIDPQISALGDEHLLDRALGNVVRNALRYSEGDIRISAVRQDDQVALTVADSGPGIPDSEIEHIFEPFFRLDPSRNRETGGTGLGLSIVRACVESCGGTVACRNLNPGFEVTLRIPAA